MEDDTSLGRLLEPSADITLVGVLTRVASLPVVTGTAAPTAATITRTTSGSGSVATRHWSAFRRYPRTTAPAQLGHLVARAIGIIDLVVALHWRARVAPIPVSAPTIATGAARPGGHRPAAIPRQPRAHSGGELATFRAAATLACGSPHITPRRRARHRAHDDRRLSAPSCAVARGPLGDCPGGARTTQSEADSSRADGGETISVLTLA